MAKNLSFSFKWSILHEIKILNCMNIILILVDSVKLTKKMFIHFLEHKSDPKFVHATTHPRAN